jgi:membrane associated rhomboid family serine protease
LNTNAIDAKAVIAVLVIIGCFAIIGIYVFRAQVPDGFVIAIVSGAISAILGFYFGHANGTTTTLATAATNLATAATQQVATMQGQTQAAQVTAAAHIAAADVAPAPIPFPPPAGKP